MPPSAPDTLAHDAALARKIREAIHTLADTRDSGDDVWRDDLDMLVRAEQRLRQALDDAAGQAFDTLSNRRRHDLRNHLGALLGYAELMQESLTGEHVALAPLTRILKATRQLLAGWQAIVSTQDPPPEPPAADDAPGHLLVLDDDEQHRVLLARYLEQLGHRVTAVATAAQAMEKLEQGDIDVLFLDLLMPDISGYQLLTRLKQHTDWRSLPVIMVSGLQDTEEVIHCIEAGADDYLTKPVNRTLLKARLRACLERKRWHDREQAYQRELEKNQRFIRHTFGRYLSNEIVAQLLENPGGLTLGGSRRKVTILMCDIRGFSTMCEQLPPERVVSLLNNYLGSLSEVIMRYNGTIDEFIGDAILAIFGAPIAREDDTDRAIACAIAMQQEMQRVNERNDALGLPHIRIGIGLHTGEVIVGNIGSEKRSKYGIVGHHVNLTARVESFTEGDDILASAQTLEDARASLEVGPPRHVQPKGIERSIDIYPIRGIGAPFGLRLPAPAH